MELLMMLLPMMFLGVLVLMFGILLCKDPEESLGSAFREGVIWSGGFMALLSVEVLVLGNT